MLKKITILVVSAVSAFALHTAELNINDLDLEVGFQLDAGQFNDAVEPNTTFVGARFLNADSSHSTDNISSINAYSEGSFLIMREIGDNGVSFGMGAKFNYAKIAEKDFSSLPLGVELAYKIPVQNLVPMSLQGSFYYAPQVLTFSDGKDYVGYRIHYDIELIKNAGLTLGYRNINTTFKDSAGFIGKNSINYNSSWYFGFKVKF